MAPIVQSSVQIANMALAHLGILTPIVALNQTGTNATACNLFYHQVTEEVLRDFPWPFAWRYAPLTLVDGTTELQANPDWQYSYRAPADAIAIHRLLTSSPLVGNFNDTWIWPGPSNDARSDTSRIPFALGSDDDGGLVFCDQPVVDATDTSLQLPQVQYISDVDVALQAPDVAQCIALKLAFYMAPALTGGDPFKLGYRAAEMYETAILKARGAASREKQNAPPPDSEFIRVRG